MKNVTLGRYIPLDSFFHKLDPRSKIIAMFAILIAIFCNVLFGSAGPFIKLGFSYFGMGSDAFSNILFAGIRFFCSGLIVLGVDTGNEIKLKLVNNVIYFFNGADDSTDLSLAYAYFDNEEAGADRFVAKESVQIGNADTANMWLFKVLANGDLILDLI